MWTEQSSFQLAKDVKFQSLAPGSETVILSLASGCLYTCNETTSLFLEALDGCRSFAEIVDLLAGEYEVTREQLLADLQGVVNDLLCEKLIVAGPSPSNTSKRPAAEGET